MCCPQKVGGDAPLMSAASISECKKLNLSLMTAKAGILEKAVFGCHAWVQRVILATLLAAMTRLQSAISNNSNVWQLHASASLHAMAAQPGACCPWATLEGCMFV